MSNFSLEFFCDSVESTLKLGRELGKLMRVGDVLALKGELGGGKTTLTQGIADGLGVDKRYYITSPTFTLINEYPADIPLYHIDLYRLEGTFDTDELGLEDYVESDGVTVIEWPERLAEGVLPQGTIYFTIEFRGTTGRKITVTAKDEDAQNRIRELSQETRLAVFLLKSEH